MTYSVYVLFDPETNDPFYVGMTSKPLALRAKGHAGEKKVGPTGKPGNIRLLYRTFEQEGAARAERRWIEAIAAHGFKLINAHAPTPITPEGLVHRKIMASLMSLLWNLEQALEGPRKTWGGGVEPGKVVDWWSVIMKELEEASEKKSKRLIRGLSSW